MLLAGSGSDNCKHSHSSHDPCSSGTSSPHSDPQFQTNKSGMHGGPYPPHGGECFRRAFIQGIVLIYAWNLPFLNSSCQLDGIPAAATRASAATAQQPHRNVLHTDESLEWQEGVDESQEWTRVSYLFRICRLLGQPKKVVVANLLQPVVSSRLAHLLDK